MIMKQCSAGHFYDAERYDSCPYCGTNEDKVHTQPNVIPVDNGLEPTVPVNPTTGFGGGETIGLDMSKEVRPVVGWLVCIEGPDRGRSYEIHKENNFFALMLCSSPYSCVQSQSKASLLKGTNISFVLPSSMMSPRLSCVVESRGIPFRRTMERPPMNPQ